MTTRRRAQRYPRPGERIAPVTLCEALREPVPQRFREVIGPMRLCDLDESVWRRVPTEAIVELGDAVVDRIGSGSARKAFEHRHFPRPPDGLKLDELPLEHRTWLCLAREGFDADPAALGERTIGEVLALRAFGPRCLVDLLTALESRLPDRSSPHERLTEAAARLGELSDAECATADDPRFAEWIRAVDVEADNAGELARRHLARTTDPPDPEYVAARIDALRQQIQRSREMTIEEELTELFAADATPRNREILAGYFGWQDGRRHTLTEVGERFGITRERTRQICAKLTRRFSHPNRFWTPSLDRAIALINERLPCRADHVERELAASGMTRVGMRIEALFAGAELLRRDVTFAAVSLPSGGDDASEVELLVTRETADAVTTAADLARREIFYHGLGRVRDLARAANEKRRGRRISAQLIRQILPLLDGFAWLDESKDWFRLAGIAKHGLPKTLDKVLAVAGEVDVATLHTALSRNRRLWLRPPPKPVLLEFCRQTPGVRVEGKRIIADPPRDWREALTGIEAELVRVLKEHGPVMDRGDLEDHCVAAGMNRFSFHAFLAWSPIVTQLGHSIYGLLGVEATAGQLKRLDSKRRARRASNRVLEDHGRNADGTVWLRYRLSKAASTYAVITIPSEMKDELEGRFKLFDPDGKSIGTLATKDGRAWGLGAFLRRQRAEIGDEIMLQIDPKQRRADVTMLKGDG